MRPATRLIASSPGIGGGERTEKSKRNALRISARYTPAHGRKVRLFLRQASFAAVMRAAGLRGARVPDGLCRYGWLLSPDPDDAAAVSPVPAPSAAVSPPASPAPSALSPPSVSISITAARLRRALRRLFHPRRQGVQSLFTWRPRSRSAPDAATPARWPALRLCRYAAQRHALCTAWRELRQAYRLSAVKSATSSSTARYGATSVVSSALTCTRNPDRRFPSTGMVAAVPVGSGQASADHVPRHSG